MHTCLALCWPLTTHHTLKPKGSGSEHKIECLNVTDLEHMAAFYVGCISSRMPLVKYLMCAGFERNGCAEGV